MKTVALRKSGGSLIFAVPALFTDINHLTAGDRLEINIDGQTMTARPARRMPRYTLDQLLAEHEGDIPRLPEWEAMPTVGLELQGSQEWLTPQTEVTSSTSP